MHKHFTKEDRIYLHKLLETGKTIYEASQYFSCHKTTIYREIKRNSKEEGKYRYGFAEKQSKKRRKKSKFKKRKIENNSFLKKYIQSGLKEYWSPEQISNVLRNEKGITLSHETIYRYIFNSFTEGKQYLRRKRKNRKKHRIYYIKKKNFRRIDERDEIVEKRGRNGDWEGDTVILKGRKQRLLTLVDRKSRFTVIRKIKEVTSGNIQKEITKIFKEFKNFTLTLDNGSEFADYLSIEKTINSKVYFAYPYHSWERGTNENTNGLIRQFCPKGDTISSKDILKVERLLNDRPRKCLGYKTPREVFFASCISN